MIRLDDQETLKLRKRLRRATSKREQRKLLLSALEMDRCLRHRKVVDVGHLPIHCELYETDRSAPVVLFVPGIGTYSEMYCELLYGLSRERLNVVGVDLRGHGYSGGPRGLYRVDQVVEDLSRVISRLEKELPGPYTLFGSSIGSVLALAAAERDERVRAVLCHTLFLTECPPDLFHLFGWNWLAMASPLVAGTSINIRTFVAIDRLLRDNPLGPLASYDDLLVWRYPLETLADVFSHRSVAYSKELGFRAAIVVGDRDELIDLDYERYIVRRMQHPFDVMVIPGGRHMLPFDRTEDVVRAAGRWLRAAR